MTKLTVGMAHYDDYKGLWPTILHLCRCHNLSDTELLVVDNSPDSAHGKEVRKLCTNVKAKYIALPDKVGTSVPRDTIFREASGEIVLCIDCHIIIDPGGLELIKQYYSYTDNYKDMITGPILYDSGEVLGTHFNNVWRAEMLGIWGRAYQCKCGGLRFSPIENYYVELISQVAGKSVQRIVNKCYKCGMELPKNMDLKDYIDLANGNENFEIFGQGLGLFGMKKEAWVGFNPDARGFGGEELYVHEKVRRAGGKVICIPGLKWPHRFDNPDGIPYNIGRYSKVRNYVLEFIELGWDLTPIYEHFIESGLMSNDDWEYLISDPLKNDDLPIPKISIEQTTVDSIKLYGSKLPQPSTSKINLDSLFNWCINIPRDLNKHAIKIRELASQAKNIVAIVNRREWDVYLLAGRPDDIIVYTTEYDLLHNTIHKIVGSSETNPNARRRVKNYTVHAGYDMFQIPESGPQSMVSADLLVIDSIYDPIIGLQNFSKYSKKRIVVRYNASYDLLQVLSVLNNWIKVNKSWFIIYNRDGFIVLSCDESDRFMTV